MGESVWLVFAYFLPNSFPFFHDIFHKCTWIRCSCPVKYPYLIVGQINKWGPSTATGRQQWRGGVNTDCLRQMTWDTG